MDGGLGGDAGTQEGCEPGVGKARGATQSCCPDFGIDACGPLLFCAALDGRTVSVCYPERSRTDGQSCASDVQCASSSCNVEVGKCKSLPGATCDAVVGCAPLKGTSYFCDSMEHECNPKLAPGAACFRAEQCSSGNCYLSAGHCHYCSGSVCYNTSDSCSSDAQCTSCPTTPCLCQGTCK